MFDLLDRVREAWKNSKFILLYDDDKREGEVDLIIPSQAIRRDHVAQMREDAGGLICTAVTDQFCRDIGIPFMRTLYERVRVQYPVINKMLSHSLPYGSKSSFSLSINHVDAFTGVTDEDRALTIKSIGQLADAHDFNNLSRSDLIDKFGNSFRIPGHVPLLRGSHGLLRKRMGHTELSIALTQITDQASSTAMCEMMDSQTGKALSVEKARKYANENDLPFISGKKVLNLWRSIQNIPKDELEVNL